MKLNWLRAVSPKLLFIPPVVLGIVIFALVAMAKKEIPRESSEEVAVPVTVHVVQPRDFRLTVTGYGTASAHQVWTSIAEVRGRVVWVHPDLDSGKTITKDEELFRIDSEDYKLRVEQRQSDWNAAKAQVDELVASETADKESLAIEEKLLKVNQQEAARVQTLVDRKAASRSDADTALGVVLRQEQQVQQLKKTIRLYPSRIASANASARMAELRLKEARRDLERCVVRAPFTGVLTGVNLEINQVVNQNERLFDLMQDDQIEIESQFSLAQLSRLMGHDGLKGSQSIFHSFPFADLDVAVTTYSGDYSVTRDAKAIRVSDSINEQTRTLGVVVSVTNRGLNQDAPNQSGELPILKPGAFCEVLLSGQTVQNSILIPRVAIEEDAVWLVDDQNRLQRKRVTLGAPFGKEIVVVAGLAAGDRVVVTPPLPALPGKLVSATERQPQPRRWKQDKDAEEAQVDAPAKRELNR